MVVGSVAETSGMVTRNVLGSSQYGSDSNTSSPSLSAANQTRCPSISPSRYSVAGKSLSGSGTASGLILIGLLYIIPPLELVPQSSVGGALVADTSCQVTDQVILAPLKIIPRVVGVGK